MKPILTFLLLALGIAAASAQNIVPTRVIGTATATNALVVSTKPTKLFCVTGYSASTQFIQIHQTNAVPAAGAVPIFSVPVSAGQYYSIDFSYYGADLDKIAVVNSSTANTLTIGANDTTFQAITRAN